MSTCIGRHEHSLRSREIAPRSDPAGTEGNPPIDGFVFELPGGAAAAVEVRRAVVARDGELPSAVREDVLLLVTELVTNAVRHAGVGPDGSLQVELRRWRQRVRVEVADPGPGPALVPTRSDVPGPGGWGLVLVDRLAARWGVARGPSRTCVWFEIDY
jgi:anti-sigma regulatory factor (Ser/Thr protein kinase)